MAELLLGKEVCAAYNASVKEKVKALAARGIHPKLAIVRVGERSSDLAYERGAVKRCESLGVTCQRFLMPPDVTTRRLIAQIEALNCDDSVHGVLLLRPLPKSLDEGRIANALNPAKDVDAMTDASTTGVYTGKAVGFPPCTAQACIEILDHYGIDVQGRRALVIGRSLVVGRPLAMLLLARNATVTIAHTRTRDLAGLISRADLVFAAAGSAGMVSARDLRATQVVIDVGINVDPAGHLTGDVEKAAESVVRAITPVPGGVGTVTTSVLVGHVVEAAMKLA